MRITDLPKAWRDSAASIRVHNAGSAAAYEQCALDLEAAMIAAADEPLTLTQGCPRIGNARRYAPAPRASGEDPQRGQEGRATHPTRRSPPEAGQDCGERLRPERRCHAPNEQARPTRPLMCPFCSGNGFDPSNPTTCKLCGADLWQMNGLLHQAWPASEWKRAFDTEFIWRILRLTQPSD